jgi:hypothetical protein
MADTQTVIDVQVENHGSLMLFQPLTETARTWITDNVGDEVTFFCGALVVEPRYAGNLFDGMVNDGLEVR